MNSKEAAHLVAPAEQNRNCKTETYCAKVSLQSRHESSPSLEHQTDIPIRLTAIVAPTVPAPMIATLEAVGVGIVV